MPPTRTIQLSLPSKGRLEGNALEFLSAAGLRVFKPNPRQYQAELPALPDLGVIFQRPGDIVVSVRQGSVDFGITGLDVIEEKRGENGDILILHNALGFGQLRAHTRSTRILGIGERHQLSQRIGRHARTSFARGNQISQPHQTFPGKI
jgi:ATP phosphoribosyltransferase